ncbi:MAG: hypothetical protein L0211_06220 [Planctomycetaceae bacterium]|nr:hypothetical protein [Planctomycetaceae bacterium]
MNIPRRRFAIAAVLLALSADLAAAQDPLRTVTEDDLKTVKARVETFFQSLTNPDLGPERAFPELIGNSPLKERTDEIKKLTEQAAALDLRYGDYSGHDFASSKAVGADLVFLRYLYKGERFPVVFCFTFYRAGPIGGIERQWSLIGLRFDSRIEALEK